MIESDDLDWLARNVHVWPGGDHQPWCYVSFNGRDFSISKFLAVPGVRTCRIDKQDWIARRAELQNKPSWDLSGSWSKYLAQDMDGEWKWLGENPSLGDEDWTADELRSQCKGVVIGDWRDTLERRPDMNKNHEEIDMSAERVQKNPDYVHFNAQENQLKFDECERRRREWSEQGGKADRGKPIMGAIPPHAELAVARVLTFGAEKYARDAWQAVENAEVRYMDAALRHLNAHRRGELADDESCESHLAHAACCILFLLDMQERTGGKNE